MNMKLEEYRKEMNILRNELSEEAIQALCSINQKLIFVNLFGYDLQKCDSENEKHSTIDFNNQNEQAVA